MFPSILNSTNFINSSSSSNNNNNNNSESNNNNNSKSKQHLKSYTTKYQHNKSIYSNNNNNTNNNITSNNNNNTINSSSIIPSSSYFNIHDYTNNYYQQNRNYKNLIRNHNNRDIEQQHQQQDAGDEQQSQIDEEIKLPKIIISNNNRKMLENSEYVNSAKSKSVQNNISELNEENAAAVADVDSIDHHNYYKSTNSRSRSTPVSQPYENVTVNSQQILLYQSNQSNEEPIKMKARKKKKKKQRSSENRLRNESEKKSPEPLLIPSEHISTDFGNTKLSYNNLRLTCYDKSKKIDASNTFKVRIKPKNKNTLLRTKISASSRDQIFASHESPTQSHHSDVEFYLSSRNNLLKNQRDYQMVNDKLKNVFNYKQLMYLKFNSNQSSDFDSYYNTSRMNILKNMHTPLGTAAVNHTGAAIDDYSKLFSTPTEKSNKVNAKVRGDFVSNSYYSLKLPKLQLKNEANDGANGYNLAQNILMSTNDFQMQHNQIQSLTKELKEEINKIVVNYPSIYSKRTNGKLSRLKTVIKDTLTKYEKSNNCNTNNDNNAAPAAATTSVATTTITPNMNTDHNYNYDENHTVMSDLDSDLRNYYI